MTNDAMEVVDVDASRGRRLVQLPHVSLRKTIIIRKVDGSNNPVLIDGSARLDFQYQSVTFVEKHGRWVRSEDGSA